MICIQTLWLHVTPFFRTHQHISTDIFTFSFLTIVKFSHHIYSFNMTPLPFYSSETSISIDAATRLKVWHDNLRFIISSERCWWNLKFFGWQTDYGGFVDIPFCGGIVAGVWRLLLGTKLWFIVLNKNHKFCAFPFWKSPPPPLECVYSLYWWILNDIKNFGLMTPSSL